VGTRKVRKIAGLKQIKVPCMAEDCDVMVPVNVAPDFKGKMRKFCHHCRQRAATTVFEGDLNDGGRHVSRR
jgi:hypothetical protein